MNSKEYWGLMEAYAEVYDSEETEQLDEIIRPTTGQLTAPKAAPRTPQSYRAGGGRQSYNQRRSGTGQMPPPATPRTSSSTPKTAPTPTARPASSTPTARPATSTPTARPATSTPKASPTPTTSSASTTAAAPKKTFNPLMQKTFGYQTGYSPDQVKKDPKKMAQMGSLRNVTSGFDMFDLVKGHLLDEGYADTEEAAIAIMANMSEEWRQSIIDEEQLQELSNRKLRAYVKKSEKSHQDLNKKWDQGTASYKDKYKSINRERGQERAFKTLDKRSGK